MRRIRTLVIFLLVLAVGSIAPVATTPSPVAQAAGPEQVLAFANVIGALFQRNRVYRNAAEVQDEVRDYYDGLLATARASLRDRDLSKLDNQLAAYIRLRRSLELEKEVTLQLLEDDKRGARRTFRTELNRQAPALLLAIPGARELAQVFRTDLGEMREVLQTMRAAVADGRPDAVLDVARRRAQLDRLAPLVGLIGGRPGRELADAVGSLGAELERIEALSDGVSGDLEAGLADADRHLGTALDRLDEQLAAGVRPTSVSLFGGLSEVRIAGRFPLWAAIAQALSASGSEAHGLTRDAMRDRIHQVLLQNRGAYLANLRDCFRANAAQLRAQLAGADPPVGSTAAALLATDLSTCDPEAVAAVLAAAAQLDVPPTSAGDESSTDSPASGDATPPVDDSSDTWSVGWGDPTSAAAQQYLVSTSNVMTTTEGPVTYWHPTVGGATEQDSPVGTLVYRIPVPAPVQGGELHVTINTYHWDYSQGSAAVDGSVDGTNWEVLASLGPPAFGGANDGGPSGELPALFIGATEIWLRVRLVAWGPQAADGAPWTNTSQHGRTDNGAETGPFSLRVDLGS